MGSIAKFDAHPQFEDILKERRKRNDFRWASRPFTPSPYFVRGRRATEPRDLLHVVLSCQRVRSAIKEVANKEGKDERDVAKRAQDVLLEMSHDYHLYTVRWFGYVLSKLAKNHFSSIFVNVRKLEQVKDCCQRYPVILLPTHRSYVDFLLLSYVCFTYELPLPVIAAGMDFMGMMGVAELLRKAGAFFIRRRFGNDSLYWSLISEYVKQAVLCGGHPMEMFVEGTRSRSGKSLYPKIGLLSAITELVRSREIPDVLILPISISYDRTLEETLYARELLGQPKPKESTNGLIKGLRWLTSQTYGSMYVNFGEFISVRESLGEPLSSSYLDDAIFTRNVQDMALNVILDHQKHLVTPLFAAVATIIIGHISEGGKSICFQKLTHHIHSFRALINPKGSDFGLPITGESLESNVRHILSTHSALVVCPKNEEHIVHFQTGEDETVFGMTLQHYANQLLPLIIPYSLLAILTKNSNMRLEVDVESVLEEYTFLRQLLFDDFIYKKGTEFEEATRAANVFNLLTNKGMQNGHTKQRIIENNEMRTILRLSIEPFIIAYWGVALTLLQQSNRQEQEAVEAKQLSKMTQGYLRQLIGQHFPTHYGALSLDTLNNASIALVKLEYAVKVKREEGSYGLVVHDDSRLASLVNRLEKYLPTISSGVDLHSVDANGSQLLKLKAKL